MQSAPEYDGSTPLSDPQRETVAQELIAGEELYSAYTIAGFKRPRGNAQRMLHEPDMVKRLKWLADRVAPYDEVMLAYRRMQHRRALEHIATADRLQLFEEKVGYRQIGKRRRRYRTLVFKPLDALTEEERALIDGIEITDKGIKVLMPKRLEARAMLAKLDGLDQPSKVEATGKDGAPLVPEITDDQRVKALAVFMAKVAMMGAQ